MSDSISNVELLDDLIDPRDDVTDDLELKLEVEFEIRENELLESLEYPLELRDEMLGVRE